MYIADDANLLPAYLRFVVGVVDSEDLPLNISREMLQNNPQVVQMRKGLTGRVISELETLAEKTLRLSEKSGRRSARSSKRGFTKTTSGAMPCSGLARFVTTKGDARTLKEYVADLTAKSDRNLLSPRR